MRWAEWRDFSKVIASSQMIEHHLPLKYLCALEMQLGAALGLPDPTQAMSAFTRAHYKKQQP